MSSRPVCLLSVRLAIPWTDSLLLPQSGSPSDPFLYLFLQSGSCINQDHGRLLTGTGPPPNGPATSNNGPSSSVFSTLSSGLINPGLSGLVSLECGERPRPVRPWTLPYISIIAGFPHPREFLQTAVVADKSEPEP